MHVGFISNIYEEIPLDGEKMFIPLKLTKNKLSIQSKHKQSHLLIVLLWETEQVYANIQQ